MTCQELTQFLDDWVQGELPARQREAFDAHMGDCPECVAYGATYRRAVEMGKRAFECEGDEVPEEVPPELVRAVLEARKREAVEAKPRTR